MCSKLLLSTRMARSFSAVLLQAVVLHVDNLSQVQDFALVLVDHHEALAGWFLQLVKAALNDSCALQYVSWSPQSGVIGKLAPSVSSSKSLMKMSNNLLQYWYLRNSTPNWASVKLLTSDLSVWWYSQFFTLWSAHPIPTVWVQNFSAGTQHLPLS